MHCPRCKTPIATDAGKDWLPFCSRRCQLIDLGAWLEEKHRIPQNESEDFSSQGGESGDNRH